MKDLVFATLTLLIVVVICATVLYSCSNANDRYYKAQSECVTQGGSWVPNGNSGSYSANCVFSRNTKG